MYSVGVWGLGWRVRWRGGALGGGEGRERGKCGVDRGKGVCVGRCGGWGCGEHWMVQDGIGDREEKEEEEEEEGVSVVGGRVKSKCGS